ncbi:protein-glutamine glutaminase family protein [Catenulispora pinisilvae]|uniref:protein-glutamine glutaminase family protein n=1 Tax=Catenulispora pinisilvae TaxID=2705253 RepID=UPI0018916901|nr:protein-glutamine glutaminase family protein [Catenulispora pinisilvae]
MGLDLPEPLRWVARIINMDSVYPQADEDQLGGLGDLWTGHQGQFLEFSSEVHGDTVDVTSAVNGPGIDMFQDTMNGLTGDSIPQIVQMMTAQSEASYGMAASVYESKISMILNTAELGVMLLYDRVVDAFFPGSGEALEEEQIPEAEITMLDIGKQLLGKVAMFGGQSAVNDALAQELTNVKFGTGFNWGEVGISAGIGALGGFFDGAITGGFMKFAPNLLKGTGWGNKLLVGGIGGVSNFASTLIGDVAQNQQIDWEQAVGALAGGTAMGLFGANHGGKGGGEGFHEEDFDEMNLAGDDFKPPVDEHFSPDLALQKVGADTNLLTFKEPPPIGGSHDDELDYLDVGSDDGSDFDADLHLDLHLDSPEIPPVSLPRIADFTGDSGSSPLPSDLGDLRSLVKNAPSDPGVKTLYLGNSGGRTPDAIVAKLNELVSNEKNFDAGKLFTPAGDNRIVLTDPVGRDGLDAVQDAVNDFAAKLPDLGPGATPPKLEVVVPVRGRDGEPGDWVVVRPSADQKSLGPVYDPRVVFFAGGGRVVLGRDQGFDVHPGGLAKAEIDPAELQALPKPVADLISTLKAGKPADPDLDKLSELARANDVNVVVLQDGEHPLHLNPDSDHQLYLLKDGKETSLLKRGPSAQDVAKTARASAAVRQALVGKIRDRLPDLENYKEAVKKVQDAARASGVGARSLADVADVTHLYDLLSGKKESGLDLVLKAAEDAKPDPDLALLGQMVKAARGGSPKALDTLLAKVPDMRVKPSARRIAGFKEGLDQLADLQQINALRQRRRVAFDRLREDLGTVPDVSAKSLRTVSKREIEQLSGKPEIADGTGRGGRADYDHAAELLGLQRETFGAADPNRISQLAALHQLVALSRRELPGMLPEDRPLTLNDFRRLIHEVRGGRLDPKWRQDVAKVANLALRAHRQDEPLTLAALTVKLRYEDLAHDLRLKPQDLANLAERTGVPPEGDWRERVLDVQNLVRDMGLKDPGDQSLTHLAAVVDVVRRDLPRTAAAARGPLRAPHVDMVLDKVFGPERTPDEDLTGLGKLIDDLTGHRDVTLASLRARAAFAAVEKHLGITHEDAARAFADAGVPTGRLDEFAVRERGVELLTLTHHLLGEGEFARLGPDGLAPTLVTARRLSDLLRSDHKESAASVVGPLRAADFQPLLDRVLGPGPKNHDEGLRQLASLADAVGARETEQNPSSTLDTGSLRFEHQWQQLPESVRGHVDTLTDGDAYTAVKTADQIIGGLTDAGPYDGLNRALDTLTLHKQVYETAGPGYREQIGSLARILAVADLGPRDSALGLDDLNGFVRKLSGEENLTATPQTLKLLANAAGAIPRGRAGTDTLARSFRYERLTTKFDADPVAASATVSALTKASGLSRGRVIEAADVVHAAGHSLDASSNGVTDRLKAADKLIALARSTSERTGDGPLGADALKPLLDQLVPNHETDAGAQRRLFQAALDNRGRLTVSKLHDGLAGRHAEGHQRSGPARDGQALHDEFASAISRNDRGDVVLTDRAEDRDAFEALPTFKNTRTVAAHVNAAAKTVRVGGKSLTYDEAARLVKHTLADDADATPVVLVACEGAEFAKVLSKELGRDVIAANGTVWQLPGHHVVAERGDSVPKQGKWWDKSAKPSATWSRYRDGREESDLGESELSGALAEAGKGFSALPAGDKDISGPAYKWTGSRESHAGALSDDDRPPSSAFQLDDTSYVPFEPDLPPSALTLGNCFHHALAASLGELDIHGIGPDPAKVPAWRHSVADRLRQSATGSDHSGETPLTIGSEESPTSRRSAQVLLSELSDDRLQELSRLHLDSTTVTRPSDVPPDSASAPRTAKNIHLERLTDLLDNGTLHERTSLLRSLSDRYTDDGKDGMAALAEYARTDTESGKGLPSYSSMLEFAQRLPSLWDSPLGDDLPESVAVLLDLHITVVRSDHTATSLNPDGATEVTLFLDTSGPRPHYQAVRSLDQHDGAPTVTRSPGGSDEQLRGAGFSSKLRGLLPSALKGGYRDLIKDTRKDLTDVLPEDEWWRLYIDPKDHEKALASLNLADAKARGVTGPGDYYDRVDPENKTKQLPEGAYPFRDGMTEALRELSKLPGVDFDSYKKLHSLAISKLADRQFQEKSSVLGRHEADNANKTSFSAWVSDPAADAESERYLNRPLLAPRTSANDAMAIFATKLPESLKVTQKLIREIGKDESDLPICTYSKEKAGAGTSLKIDVNYTLAARRPLYEAIMREYLRGIRDSAGESDRLRAIGKAVRALHVAHFFPDGNGRTHLSLLLQKLLLDNGFGVAVLPAAAPEGAVGQDAERTFFKLFNGGASLDTIVDELRSSIARTAEFHGPQTEASHPNAHVQTLDASGSHHPVAGPSNAHVGNPHVVPGVDHLSEHAHLLLEQSGHLVFPSHADDQAAFTALPRFDGHRTVAAHIDKATGTVKLDSETQSLTYEQAAGILIDRLGPGEEPIVLVGCDGADFAAVLSRLTGRDVIAADGTVWQLPGHTVVTSHTTTPPPAHRFWSNEIRPADEPTWSRYRNGERVFDSDTEDLAEAMAKLAPSARRSVGETDIASAHRWLPPTGTKHPGVPDRVSDLAAGNRDRVATNAEVKNLADQIGVGHQDRLGGLVLTAEDRNARLTHVGGLADVLRPSAELDIDRATQARRLYDLIRKNGLGPDDSGAFDPHQALAGLAELLDPDRPAGPFTAGEGQRLLHAVRQAKYKGDPVDTTALRTAYRDAPKVTSDVASDLFTRLASEKHTDLDGTEQPIPFGFPDDGCYDRAYAMAEKLTNLGFSARKVFAVRSGGQKLTVSAETAERGFWGQPKDVTWGYHVATLLEGLDENGFRTEYVFDPSLHKGLLGVDGWLSAMGVEPGGARRLDLPDTDDGAGSGADGGKADAAHMLGVANRISSLIDTVSTSRRNTEGDPVYNWTAEKPLVLTTRGDRYWLSSDQATPMEDLSEHATNAASRDLGNRIKALRRFFTGPDADQRIKDVIKHAIDTDPAFKVQRDTLRAGTDFAAAQKAFGSTKDFMLFNKIKREYRTAPDGTVYPEVHDWRPNPVLGGLFPAAYDHGAPFFELRSDGRVLWLGGGEEQFDPILRAAFENLDPPFGQVAVILPGRGASAHAGGRTLSVDDVIGLLGKAGVAPDRPLALLMSEAAEGADSFAGRLAKAWQGPVTAPNSPVSVNLRTGQAFAATSRFDVHGTLQPMVNGRFLTFDPGSGTLRQDLPSPTHLGGHESDAADPGSWLRLPTEPPPTVSAHASAALPHPAAPVSPEVLRRAMLVEQHGGNLVFPHLAEDTLAATALPHFTGHRTVAVHIDKATRTVRLGSESLSYDDAAAVLAYRLGTGNDTIVLVGCDGADFAATLSRLTGRDVIAADGTVWQLPGRTVVTSNTATEPVTNHLWWQQKPADGPTWRRYTSDGHVEVSAENNLTTAMTEFAPSAARAAGGPDFATAHRWSPQDGTKHPGIPDKISDLASGDRERPATEAEIEALAGKIGISGQGSPPTADGLHTLLTHVGGLADVLRPSAELDIDRATQARRLYDLIRKNGLGPDDSGAFDPHQALAGLAELVHPGRHDGPITTGEGQRLLHAVQRAASASDDVDLSAVRDFYGNGPKVTSDVAQDLFSRLSRETYTDSDDGNRPIPFDYPEDGCYDRAHVLAEKLTEWGYAPRKVFAVRSGGQKLTVSAETAVGGFWGDPKEVTWGYHVATIVEGLDENGLRTEYVFDPSLHKGLLTVDEWGAVMKVEPGGSRRVDFPDGPDPRAKLPDSAGENAGHEVTLTAMRTVANEIGSLPDIDSSLRRSDGGANSESFNWAVEKPFILTAPKDTYWLSLDEPEPPAASLDEYSVLTETQHLANYIKALRRFYFEDAPIEKAVLGELGANPAFKVLRDSVSQEEGFTPKGEAFRHRKDSMLFNRVVRKHQDGPSDAGSGADDRWKPEFTPGSLKSTQADHSTLFLAVRSSDGRVVWLGGGKESDSALRTAFENVKVPAGQVAVILPGHGEFVQAEDRKQAVENVVGLLTKAGVAPDTKLTLLMSEAAENAQAVKAGRIVSVKDGEIKVVMKNGVPDRQDSFAAQLAKVWDGSVTAPNSSVFVNLRNGQVRAVTVAHDAGDVLQPKVNGAFITFDKANPNGRVSDESWHGFEPSDRDDVWVRPPTDSIASTDLLSSVTTYSWGSSKQDAAHEARIGGYLLAKQSSLTAARDMVVKLRTTLRNLNPGVDHAVLDKAFFQDDVTGSGQVGPTVRLDDLLRDGNTRELMTAFYNGAYFSRGEHTFLTTMLRRDNLGHQWLLKTAGRVDVDKLGAYREHIREATPDAPAGSASLAAQAIQFTESGHLANHFGGLATSTALTPKTEAAADLLRSAAFRDKRPDPAKALFRMTQVDLKGYGVGLGKYELAHLLRTHPELGDDEKEPLPWITGQLWSEVKTGTDWYQKVVTDGRMPVLSGPSGTAARLYLLAKLFDPAGDHEDFLGALTGWMLAGHDHSAYEIVQALRAVGYAKPGAHSFIKTSEDLYRAIPGLHADELHPNGYLRVPSGTDVAVTFKDSVHTTATGWSVTDRGDEFDTASALTMPAGWKSLAVHLDAETGHVLVKGRMLTDDQTLALFRPLVEKTLADGQGLALVACGGDKLAELLTTHYPDLDIASMNDLAVQYPDGRVVAGKLNGTAVVPTPKSWWNTQNETTHVPAVSHWSGGKKQHSYDRILGDALKKIKANSGPESETGPRSGPTASVRKPAAEPLTLTVDDETYTWTGFTGGSDRLVPSRFDLVDAAGIRRPLTLASAAEFLRNRGYTLTDEREAALNLYLHGTTKPGKDYKDSWFGAALLNRRIGKVLTAIRNLGTRYFDPARDNVFDQQVYRDARGQLLRIPDTEFSAPAHVLNDGASDRFDITEAQFDAHWRAFPPKVTQVPTTSVGFDRGPRDFKPELLPSARRYSPPLKASPLWYRDDNSPLYRWDLREPGAVFGTGFRPGNRDLARSLRYYVAQKHATGLISTTRTPDWIHTLDFAIRQDHRVYRYTIDAPGGIDVLSTLGTKSPFPNEYEVAFWDGIRPEFITGVQEGHIPFPGAAPVWGAWTDRQTWLSRHTSTLAPGTDVLSAVHDSLQWHDHEAYAGDAHIGGFTLVNGPEDLGMAAALPRLPGIVNIAVHGDPAIPGNYLLRGRSYTAAELAPVLAGYLAHPALAPYVHGVAVIGCNGAPLGEALSAAMFHGHGGWDVPVISTTGKVWQIAGGEVRASVPDHVPGTVSLPGATPWWAPGAGPTHAPQNVWTVHGGGVLSSDLGSELTGTYQHVLATYYPHVTDTARMSPFAGKALSLGPYSWSGPHSSKAHENALAVERQNGPEKLSVVRPGADLQKVLGIDSQDGNGFSPSSGLLAAAKKVLDGPPLHLDADSFGRLRDDLVKDLPGLDRTPFHDATTGLPKSVTFSGRKVSSIAADLTEETYQGRRLLASFDRASSILHEDLPSSGNTAAMFGARQSDLPVALVKDGVVRLNYSSGSGRVLLRTILDSYRLDVSRLSDHPYDQLRTIAKTVRALQVSGFFGGREGSVVRNVLLQKLLLDRGFGTAKLDPVRPGEFSGSAQVLETNPWADNTRIDNPWAENPWADNAETAAPPLDPHLDPDELFSGSRPLDEIVDELVAGITRAGNSHQGSPEVQLLVARPETTLTVRQDRKLPDNPVLVYKDSGSSRTWRISDSAGGLFSTEKSAGAFQNHLALHWLTGGRDSSLPFSSLPSAVRAKMVSALMDLHEWQPGYDLAARAKEAERALAWFDPRTLDSLDGYVPAHGDVIWLANDKFVGAARVVETGGPQGPMVEAFVPAGKRVAMTTWERFKADAANNFPGAKYVVGTDVDTALGSGYSELIHSSRQNLSDVLPEPEWWKLYINPKDHGLAEEVLHNRAWEGAGMSRPGDLYDVEKRVPKSERGRPPEANSGDVVPGHGQYPFRDSMESSYKKFLDSADGSQLGFGEYHQFHAETVKLMPRNRFTGFHKPSTVLHEPDEAKTQFPISGKPADDLENETYLGRHLIQRESADNNLSQLVSERDVTRHPDDPPLDDPYYRRSNLVPWGEYKQSDLPITVHTDSNIYANYSLSAREPIYRAIMHEYVRGIKAATDDGAKLTAIAKAVRALHISHLYGDGNGRTHLSLLLQKLLLDNGFRVTVLPGTDIGGAGTFDSLFSGGYPLAAIVEAIKHGMVPPPPVPDRTENLAESLAENPTENLALVSTG